MQVFKPGDTVRIRREAFPTYVGTVKRVDQSKMILEVEVVIFGRVTPIEVTFSDAEVVHYPPARSNLN